MKFIIILLSFSYSALGGGGGISDDKLKNYLENFPVIFTGFMDKPQVKTRFGQKFTYDGKEISSFNKLFEIICDENGYKSSLLKPKKEANEEFIKIFGNIKIKKFLKGKLSKDSLYFSFMECLASGCPHYPNSLPLGEQRVFFYLPKKDGTYLLKSIHISYLKDIYKINELTKKAGKPLLKLSGKESWKLFKESLQQNWTVKKHETLIEITWDKKAQFQKLKYKKPDGEIKLLVPSIKIRLEKENSLLLQERLRKKKTLLNIANESEIEELCKKLNLNYDYDANEILYLVENQVKKFSKFSVENMQIFKHYDERVKEYNKIEVPSFKAGTYFVYMKTNLTYIDYDEKYYDEYTRNQMAELDSLMRKIFTEFSHE